MIKTLIFEIKRLLSAKYVLKGKCKQCGTCCRNIVFYIENNPIKTEEQFNKLKKWKKSYNNFFISGTDTDGALLFTCKSLEDNICKDYKFRSLACRLYPQINQKFVHNGGQPLDGCGYWFEKNKKFEDFLN